MHLYLARAVIPCTCTYSFARAVIPCTCTYFFARALIPCLAQTFHIINISTTLPLPFTSAFLFIAFLFTCLSVLFTLRNRCFDHKCGIGMMRPDADRPVRIVCEIFFVFKCEVYVKSISAYFIVSTEGNVCNYRPMYNDK